MYNELSLKATSSLVVEKQKAIDLTRNGYTCFRQLELLVILDDVIQLWFHLICLANLMQNPACLLSLGMEDKPARALGHKNEANEHQYGRNTC